jgi:multidrug efflux pump subunit AcrA (membrane-fusion protein)
MKQDVTASPSRTERPSVASGSVIGETLRIGAPIAILLFGIGAFMALKSMKESPSNERERSVAPTVETIVVKPHAGALNISIDGLVVPFREIDLAAEVSGRVAKKYPICREGNYVKAGTPLLEIDARDYELEVERLKRELAQAAVAIEELDVEVTNTQALVRLAKEQHVLHRKDVRRQEQLVERRIVSDSELEQTKRDALTTLNSVMTLENQALLLSTRRNRLVGAHDLWQSQLSKAQLDLRRTRVASPINGVIISEMLEEDSYVQKGDSLAKIEDTSAVEVKCNLRMEDLYWLWAQEDGQPDGDHDSVVRDYQIPQAPVTVRYDLAGRGYIWDGILSRFDGIGLDERTRTVPCRILVANPRVVRIEGSGDPVTASVGPPALVRGMYVSVTVQAQPKMALLEIPQRAVQPGNKVWQVVDGRLAIHRVRVADSDDDVVLVYAEAAGLKPGMKLVSSPLAMAVDGMPVQERTEE